MEMPLPPVAFYSIYEISARWGCPAADIAGWAAAGHLQVLAGIPPVSCGEESIAGTVEVWIAELMPMFRRFGPSDEQGRLKRVKPLGSATWLKVTEPPDGLPIRSSDLLLAAGPLQQFEEERELLRRPASHMAVPNGLTRFNRPCSSLGPNLRNIGISSAIGTSTMPAMLSSPQVTGGIPAKTCRCPAAAQPAISAAGHPHRAEIS